MALASTTWYVNGVSGSDGNNCKSPTNACKTIGHAISLASSGDTIMVAAAIYNENLTISIGLTILGSGARTTIIDGGHANTVVTIPSSATHVGLASVTIRNGSTSFSGGGINNGGILTVANTAVSGNRAGINGGGILNTGTLMVFETTISGNSAGWSTFFRYLRGGGGVANFGTFTLVNSTLKGNSAYGSPYISPMLEVGGGIKNSGSATIRNTTFAANLAGILFPGNPPFRPGRGWDIYNSGQATTQNSIFGSAGYYGYFDDCYGSVTSNGYNLSRDNTCNFHNSGDRNNTNPMLGPLQDNGGPTDTMALPSGSPAIDAGNPSGCRDNHGNLLKTDQRGMPRPNKEDTGGCDMGAYERQGD